MIQVRIFILFISVLVSVGVHSQNTVLWKVTDTLNQKSSFILGTFHQFGNSFVDSIPEIKAYLLQSDIAVFESIENVELIRGLINQRESSKKIKKHLNKEELLKLLEIAKDWKVDLYKLKPIEIRWKLQQEYQKRICRTSIPEDDFDEMDGYIEYLAREHQIEVVGLESDQLEMVNKVSGYPSWKKEKASICFWIRKLFEDQATEEYCILANKYRVFDIEYEFEKECEQGYLIQGRNNLWMKKILEITRTQNAFIAVGYRHLIWKCGLLEQLRQEGFTIEPVKLISG